MGNLNYQFNNTDKVLSPEASVPEAFRDVLREDEAMIHLEIQLLDNYKRPGYTHLEGPAPRVLSDTSKKCFPQLKREYRLAVSRGCMIRVAAPRSEDTTSIFVCNENGVSLSDE